jgi:hypothetical protein
VGGKEGGRERERDREREREGGREIKRGHIAAPWGELIVGSDNGEGLPDEPTYTDFHCRISSL